MAFYEGDSLRMGVAFNRADPDQVELMDLLNATPAISEKQGAASVAEALQSGMAAMKAHQDEPNVRLHGALGFAQTALPGDPRSLLISLGMHDHKDFSPRRILCVDFHDFFWYE